MIQAVPSSWRSPTTHRSTPEDFPGWNLHPITHGSEPNLHDYVLYMLIFRGVTIPERSQLESPCCCFWCVSTWPFECLSCFLSGIDLSLFHVFFWAQLESIGTGWTGPARINRWHVKRCARWAICCIHYMHMIFTKSCISPFPIPLSWIIIHLRFEFVSHLAVPQRSTEKKQCPFAALMAQEDCPTPGLSFPIPWWVQRIPWRIHGAGPTFTYIHYWTHI